MGDRRDNLHCSREDRLLLAELAGERKPAIAPPATAPTEPVDWLEESRKPARPYAGRNRRPLVPDDDFRDDSDERIGFEEDPW